MKKAIYIFMSLCFAVLSCGGEKANLKDAAADDRAVSNEEKLGALRARVKAMFPDVIGYNQIGPKYFERGGDYNVFRVRFSGIIYESGGKIVRVPIFRGTMGDVLYDDFLKYCEMKKIIKDGSTITGHAEYLEDGFEVRFNKGEFNKTLNEFKEFYGRSLSINFKKEPARVYFFSNMEQINTYVFTLGGLEGELSFFCPHEQYEGDAVKLEYSITVW